jgi:hypothetical protein
VKHNLKISGDIVMKKVFKKAAFKAVKYATGGLLEQVGSRIFTDFEGEFELKNGRRVRVKSIGTAENPVFELSVLRKSTGAYFKDIMLKFIAFTLGLAGFIIFVKTLFNKK